MRPSNWFYALLLIGTAVPVSSANKKSNDRQIDGFSGPVKIVATRVERNTVELQEPDGPAVVLPAGCEECGYDQDGNRIRFGPGQDQIQFVRDSTGAIIERVVRNEKGEVTGRSVLGPFGSVEDLMYSDRQLESRRTYRYDDRGNIVSVRRTHLYFTCCWRRRPAI
jgi:hypothetical protein